MQPSIQTLGKILYSPSQYVIPVFQRNYRWEAANWQKYWDALVEIRRPEKRGNHFMGFLVFVPGLAQPGQNTTFHLIDGQQRLTTSSILLVALRNVARQMNEDELADEIHGDYLIHARKRAEQHYRLLPKERDHDSYVSIVEGTGSAVGRIPDALAFFEEQVVALVEGNPSALREMFHAVCGRLEFMCATLEAENAYNIFKSLNSTGVPLGPSDLIRNFVFMHVLPDEQDAFDRERWAPLEEKFANSDGTLNEESFSRFFRDYLMSMGRYVSPRATFETFEARFESTGFAPQELAAELLSSVRAYAVIASAERDGSEAVTSALAGLNALDSSTTYPLLLALFRKRTSGTIDSDQLARCVEMLRGFILRRFICGETSRGYGQMFVRALAQDTGDTVGTLDRYLVDRGWPDDNKFQSSFATFPVYQKDYARPILETLERARGHKEAPDLKAAQIEHIMPQTLNDDWLDDLGGDATRVHAEWLHRPGNLTLSAYNQELWNHRFTKKRQTYQASNVGITRDLAKETTWGETQMALRSEALAAEASAIWIGPKDPPAKVDSGAGNEDGPGRRELRSRFWSALSDYLVSEHPDLPVIESRPNFTIRVPSALQHVGIELRLGLRQQNAGIDVWFWRQASMPVWREVQESRASWNELVSAVWEFEQVEGGHRARMSLNLSADMRDETAWPEIHRWMGEKLSLVYVDVIPRIRQAMG